MAVMGPVHVRVICLSKLLKIELVAFGVCGSALVDVLLLLATVCNIDRLIGGTVLITGGAS